METRLERLNPNTHTRICVCVPPSLLFWQGCLNTSAPVGTEFVVAFTVFDRSVPANNHTASRSITVTEPCEPGLVWCPLDRLCGVTACDVRLRLVPQVTVDVHPPVVTLALPGVNLTADAQADNAPASLTLTYGEVTSQPFTVCESGQEAGVEVSAEQIFPTNRSGLPSWWSERVSPVDLRCVAPRGDCTTMGGIYGMASRPL